MHAYLAVAIYRYLVLGVGVTFCYKCLTMVKPVSSSVHVTYVENVHLQFEISINMHMSTFAFTLALLSGETWLS